MSLKNIRENRELILFIAKTKNKKLLYNILSNLDTKFIKLLREIILNLLHNNKINISHSTKIALAKNKNILRNILTKKSQKSLKKEILNIPAGKGGWASILLPILGTIIGGVLKKIF